jgi:hypothetical protein
MTHTIHLIGNWYLVNLKSRKHQQMVILGNLKRKLKYKAKKQTSPAAVS